MIQQLDITAIVENTAGVFDIAGEWGLALWIQSDQYRILCDTGRGQALLPNARQLGLDLAAAEALVVSHGHYDHTGGIAALMGNGFQGKIYAHPAARTSKYRREKKPPNRVIGIPEACEAALRARSNDVVETTRPTEIRPGLIVTGSIPRRNQFELPDPQLCTDENCTQTDGFVDDQALLIESPKGWVVVTGCAHAGLINTLDYAAELTGSKRFFAVIGGLHLFDASSERIRATVEKLDDFGVERIAAGHCTGFSATGALLQRFGGRVTALPAGQTLRIPEQR